MRKLAFLCAMGLSVMSLMAQKTSETVYLKNGSVIRGDVIEQVPNQSLKVQTRDGSVFVYQMDEVERITKEQSTGRGFSSKYNHGHNGLDYTIEAGVNAGKGGYANGKGYIEVGKRFTANYYWGVGFGGEGGSGDPTMPIATTFKALFPVTSNGIAPNIAFRTGFRLNIEHFRRTYSDLHPHSILFAIMPGVQIPISQKVDFNVNLGYACSVGCNGSGAGHSFMATIGIGIHKP